MSKSESPSFLSCLPPFPITYFLKDKLCQSGSPAKQHRSPVTSVFHPIYLLSTWHFFLSFSFLLHNDHSSSPSLDLWPQSYPASCLLSYFPSTWLQEGAFWKTGPVRPLPAPPVLLYRFLLTYGEKGTGTCSLPPSSLSAFPASLFYLSLWASSFDLSGPSASWHCSWLISCPQCCAHPKSASLGILPNFPTFHPISWTHFPDCNTSEVGTSDSLFNVH